MEKITGKKINESANFTPEIIKLVLIKLINNILFQNLEILGLKMLMLLQEHLASKFDEFKRIFDILMIREIKLDNTFPTSQFYIERFSMPYMLDRNRNNGRIKS